MDWMKLLQEIFCVCIIPLLGVLTTYLIQFLRAKGNQIAESVNNELAAKYIKMLTETICACVDETNQTYVDALKASGSFDAEAQKQAFMMCKDAVMKILSNEAKDYLASIYGDLDKFIESMIEAQVKQAKKSS